MCAHTLGTLRALGTHRTRYLEEGGGHGTPGHAIPGGQVPHHRAGRCRRALRGERHRSGQGWNLGIPILSHLVSPLSPPHSSTELGGPGSPHIPLPAQFGGNRGGGRGQGAPALGWPAGPVRGELLREGMRRFSGSTTGFNLEQRREKGGTPRAAPSSRGALSPPDPPPGPAVLRGKGDMRAAAAAALGTGMGMVTPGVDMGSRLGDRGDTQGW